MAPTLANAFVAGVIAAGYAIIGLFFLRFFVRTREVLFAAFAAAFVLMAVNQGLVGLLNVPREEQSPFYLLRMAAFLLIIAAVLWKNRRTRRS